MNTKHWTTGATEAAERHLLSADERREAENLECASFNGVPVVTYHDVLAVIERRQAQTVAS